MKRKDPKQAGMEDQKELQMDTKQYQKSQQEDVCQLGKYKPSDSNVGMSAK
jgi:hypothetical protein